MSVLKMKSFALAALTIFTCLVASADAQRVTYKYIDVTETVDVPVTKPQWVEETQLEREKQTRYKQIIQTEQRTRETVQLKPVTETKYRVEKKTLLKPVTVTKYRQRKSKETTYKTVEGFRDETVTIEEPVIETEMRTEKVTVRKPVAKELVEVQRTTSYKPVVKQETQYVYRPGETQYQTLPDLSRRPRIRFLRPGYYTDPTTGVAVYRSRGLHWEQPNAVVPAITTPPALVPQEVERIEYEPQVTETRRPITVKRMVEETVERQVPHQVKKMVARTVTRKVPYSYKMPVEREIVEEVPYTETEYREEVVERKIPYTQSSVKEIRSVETYDVDVPKYVKETSVKEKPITKWVEKNVETTESRKITKRMKVPVDADGNALSAPVPVDSYEYEFEHQLPSIGSSTTTTKKPVSASEPKSFTAETKILDDDRTTVKKPATVLVPETKITEGSKMARLSTGPAVDADETGSPTPAKKDAATTVTGQQPALSILAKPVMPEPKASPHSGNESAAD